MSTLSDHSSTTNFTLHELTKITPFLGLQLYIVICVFLFIFLFLVLLIFLCIRWNRTSDKPCTIASQSSVMIPLVSKEIVKVKALDLLGVQETKLKVECRDRRRKQVEDEEGIDVGGFQRVKQRNDEIDAAVDGLNIGWGRWYSLEELRLATRGFADDKEKEVISDRDEPELGEEKREK